MDDPTEQHLNLMDPHGGRVSIYLESLTLQTPHQDDRVLAALTEADAAVIDLADHARPLSGLSDKDARRSTVDSGTNLAGLTQHLTFVESMWFEEFVAGGKAARGVRSMRVDPSVPLRTLRADYRAACATSNAIITSSVTRTHR